MDAYLLSDEDEDLAANYLSVVNGESLGGSDDPLDVGCSLLIFHWTLDEWFAGASAANTD